RWFPDNKAIAFLKRTGNTIQIWRTRIDGSLSAPVTHSDTDILDFRIARDGRTIVYSASPALQAAWSQIDKEGLSGFHFDDRFAPNASTRPFPSPPIPVETFTLDLASGKVRAASVAEAALLQDDKPRGPPGAMAVALSPSGRRAWTKPTLSERFPPRPQLVAESLTGSPISCEARACRSVTTLLGWSADGARVRFTHLEGWANSQTAIYEWKPGARTVTRLYVTSDLLVDCAPLNDDLACVEENSSVPRHISLLRLATGEDEVLFDPNPEFGGLRLGQVERLTWKSAFGTESFGDLVYPAGYQPGQRYPLIVVQYISRGFLRGGTGDEYPIQAFANRGYAVLSIQRPRSPVAVPDAASYTDLDKADLVGFKDRKNVLSAIETAVQSLIDRGIVDPKRVGITGLSDGASTVQFAGLHSRYFSVAAMSSCCWERSQMAMLGPAVARQYVQTGWPHQSDKAPGFWNEISWAQQPRRVAFPVLMQLSDNELLPALEAYTALAEVNAPVDLYVYPHEDHVKWQPAHRLAVYRRNLDWFDFWFKGSAPDAPPAEISRWQALRDRMAERARKEDADGGPITSRPAS
uniref:Atxe2 family lasso peptide isopeptidase n=1 Tax=Novosphingobium naphthalenivorans TaxID=273168 RepID=UPI00082CDB02